MRKMDESIITCPDNLESGSCSPISTPVYLNIFSCKMAHWRQSQAFALIDLCISLFLVSCFFHHGLDSSSVFIFQFYFLCINSLTAFFRRVSGSLFFIFQMLFSSSKLFFSLSLLPMNDFWYLCAAGLKLYFLFFQENTLTQILDTIEWCYPSHLTLFRFFFFLCTLQWVWR